MSEAAAMMSGDGSQDFCLECGHPAYLHGVILGEPPERSSTCDWRADPWGSDLDDGCDCQAYEAPFR